jgi:hypothetical protein
MCLSVLAALAGEEKSAETQTELTIASSSTDHQTYDMQTSYWC